MRIYKVKVHRDGRWWMVAVPEIDQITQTRRLADVETMARSLIAVSTDAPITDVAVEVTAITLADGDDVLSDARDIEELRHKAQTTEAQAAEASRAYARRLTQAGVAVRDAATLLHVSPQRVSQLANS